MDKPAAAAAEKPARAPYVPRATSSYTRTAGAGGLGSSALGSRSRTSALGSLGIDSQLAGLSVSALLPARVSLRRWGCSMLPAISAACVAAPAPPASLLGHWCRTAALEGLARLVALRYMEWRSSPPLSAGIRECSPPSFRSLPLSLRCSGAARACGTVACRRIVVLTPADSHDAAQEKPAIVIEFGAMYTKCGFAGEANPRHIIPSTTVVNEVRACHRCTAVAPPLLPGCERPGWRMRGRK